MREEIVAIMIDGAFYQRRALSLWGERNAEDRVEELERYCKNHLVFHHGDRKQYDTLYRIFYYDCPPVDDNVFLPLKKCTISLRNTPTYKYSKSFHTEIVKRRKVALRLGKLDTNELYYALTYDAQKKLIAGKITISDLRDEDFRLNIKQKGVDMRIGLDIAALAYKKLVTRIILISGDSDFVPVAKLARREGIDFILDPMGAQIRPELSEHVDGIRSHVKIDPLSIGKNKNSP